MPPSTPDPAACPDGGTAPGGSTDTTPRWCPSCRRAWPGDREACPRCLATLVDELDATVVCRHCGRESPARMQSCPGCLAELHPDPETAVAALTEILALGGRLFRPDGVPPFAGGAACTLLRLAPRAALIYAGADELVEASVEGLDHRAVPPLRCVDLDGALLFRLDRYEPVDGALMATGADGAALATFLPGPEAGRQLRRARRDQRAGGPVPPLGAAGRRLRAGGDRRGPAADRCPVRRRARRGGRRSVGRRPVVALARPDLPLRPLGGVALALAA